MSELRGMEDGPALAIIGRLREAGHTAYLAGGCVRDLLLGREAKDEDVATDATPTRVAELFERTQEVGASFGVMLVYVEGSRLPVEVATFRSDGPYSDRRRPDSVRFSDPEQDAQRRDFTINALFLDPFGEETRSIEGARTVRRSQGLVIDYVGGLADLEAKLIRAVGDADRRLEEDDLRALRAVRFAARYGFTIEEETAQAIRRHASELRGISRERIGDEVRRMLADPSRAVAAWTLQYLGLDEAVLGHPHSDAAPRRLGRLEDGSAYGTCLAAWLLDRGRVVEQTQIAGAAAELRRALDLSNDERDLVRAVLRDAAVLMRGWDSMRVSEQKRLAMGPAFGEAMRLVSASDPEQMVRIQRRLGQLEQIGGGLAPARLVSGDDLVADGFRPGPGFGDVLEAVYDAQLEGAIADREAGLGLARELARELAERMGRDADGGTGGEQSPGEDV